MLKHVPMLFVILCILLFTSGIQSQDKTDTENEKPQTQPAKLYDLTPTYTKNMSWTEKIKIESSVGGSEVIDTTYDATCTLEVKDMKNNKPTSVKYSKFKCKSKYEDEFERKPMWDDEGKEIKELFPSSFTSKVDEHFRLSDLPDVVNIFCMLDFYMHYPACNLTGFMPPTKVVKIGDTWKSDKLIAVNYDRFANDFSVKLITSDNTGEFCLKSVENKNKIDIATMSWKGGCKIKIIDLGGINLTLKWDFSIKFDLTNKRLLSTDGFSKIMESSNEEFFNKVEVARSLEHKKDEPKEQKPELKPKTDDDE